MLTRQRYIASLLLGYLFLHLVLWYVRESYRPSMPQLPLIDYPRIGIAGIGEHTPDTLCVTGITPLDEMYEASFIFNTILNNIPTYYIAYEPPFVLRCPRTLLVAERYTPVDRISEALTFIKQAPFKTKPWVGLIMLSDEDCRAYHPIYRDFDFVYRSYQCSQQQSDLYPNTFYLPLGFASIFSKIPATTELAAKDRSIFCFFGGDPKSNIERRLMLQSFNVGDWEKRLEERKRNRKLKKTNVEDPKLQYLQWGPTVEEVFQTHHWSGKCTIKATTGNYPKAQSPLEYKSLLAHTAFALCPSGFSTEQFRIYEALEVGAIPVINASHALVKFKFPHIKPPPFPAVSSFETAALMREVIRPLLQDASALDQLQERSLHWWSQTKEGLRNHLMQSIHDYEEKQKHSNGDSHQDADKRSIRRSE